MIIKSKTESIKINLSTVMNNTSDHYLVEDVIRSIEHQAPELLKFTKDLDKWISLDDLQVLINSLDVIAEQNKRFQNGRVHNSVKKESQKLYVSRTNNFDPSKLIELGISDSVPVNRKVDKSDYIKELKELTLSWDLNMETKNLLHSAIYQIAQQPNKIIFVVNSLGMNQ